MELPVACARGSLFHGSVRSLPRIRRVGCNFVNAVWNRDFLDDATVPTVRRCDGAQATKGSNGWERAREGVRLKRRRLVKRNRPSRLNIRGTHAGTSFCRTSRNRERKTERRRDGETAKERCAYARGKEPKDRKRQPASTEFFSANRLLN